MTTPRDPTPAAPAVPAASAAPAAPGAAAGPGPGPGPDRNARAIAALRIAVGVLFLIFGEYKVLGAQFALGGGFERWIHGFLDEHAAYPFMVPLLRDWVLPHARPIALLVSGGELAIGLSLVLGLWSRAASGCGLAYMLALLFSSNYPGSGLAPWRYAGAALEHLVLALCFGAFLLGRPEAAASVRAWLRARPSRPLHPRR